MLQICQSKAIHLIPNAPRFSRLLTRMTKKITKRKKIKGQALDNLLDSLVWMRRKAKKRKPVDDLIDELISMRRKAKKKAVIPKRSRKKRQ